MINWIFGFLAGTTVTASGFSLWWSIQTYRSARRLNKML